MLDKVALVYGQMNEPPGARLRVGLSGLTMAEYFRDEGQDVLLFIDNIFRFTQAGSEVSALLGRMPSAVGYQPTLATEMGQLQERITSTRTGSVTSVQAIYVPADDLTDPAPANTFAHLDSTTVLTRTLVEQGIYPAVDPLDSNSRALQPGIVSDEHYDRRDAGAAVLQRYKELQDIIAILGIEELSGRGPPDGVARAQDPAFPLAAELRRRAVHRHAGRVREARGHDHGLHARSSTASTTTCPSRRSTWSGRSRRRSRRGAASPARMRRSRRPTPPSRWLTERRGRACSRLMPDKTFSVSLVTPDGAAFEGEAVMLIVPGADGRDRRARAARAADRDR